MHPVREQLIKTGNIIAAVTSINKLGKTAKKRAKRFKLAAEARNIQSVKVSQPAQTRKQSR